MMTNNDISCAQYSRLAMPFDDFLDANIWQFSHCKSTFRENEEHVLFRVVFVFCFLKRSKLDKTPFTASSERRDLSRWARAKVEEEQAQEALRQGDVAKDIICVTL